MKPTISNKSLQPAQSIQSIALITAICLLADSMLYVVLPLYWKEAGLSSLYEVGILLSVNRFIRLPLNPIVSWGYKKLPITTGMIIAILLTGVVTFMYSQAQGFWFWFALRCVWGLVWTFLRLGAFYAILNLSTEHNRGFLMGRYNGLSRLGSLFGMLAGGGLVWVIGMQAIFQVFAVLTLGALFLAFKVRASADLLPQSVPASSAATHSPRQPQSAAVGLFRRLAEGLLTKPVVLALLTGLVTAYLFQGVFSSTLSHILDLRLTEAGIGASFLMNAAMLGGLFQAIRWLWEPWLAPWIGRKSDQLGTRVPLLIITLCVTAGLFALIPVPAPLLLWLVVLLLIQAAATVLTTLCDTIAADVSSTRPDKTMVITVYSMMIDLGSAFGPMIAYSFSVTALYVSSAVLLAALASLWLVHRERQIVH